MPKNKTQPNEFEKEICKNWREYKEYPNDDSDKSQWIWEFTRRNHEYQNDWKLLEKVYLNKENPFLYFEDFPDAYAINFNWNSYKFNTDLSKNEQKSWHPIRIMSWILTKWKIILKDRLIDISQYVQNLNPSNKWDKMNIDFFYFSKVNVVEPAHIKSISPKNLRDKIEEYFKLDKFYYVNSRHKPFLSYKYEHEVFLSFDKRLCSGKKNIELLIEEAKVILENIKSENDKKYIIKKAMKDNLTLSQNLRLYDASTLCFTQRDALQGVGIDDLTNYSRIFKRMRDTIGEMISNPSYVQEKLVERSL